MASVAAFPARARRRAEGAFDAVDVGMPQARASTSRTRRRWTRARASAESPCARLCGKEVGTWTKAFSVRGDVRGDQSHERGVRGGGPRSRVPAAPDRAAPRTRAALAGSARPLDPSPRVGRRVAVRSRARRGFVVAGRIRRRWSPAPPRACPPRPWACSPPRRRPCSARSGCSSGARCGPATRSR